MHLLRFSTLLSLAALALVAPSVRADCNSEYSNAMAENAACSSGSTSTLCSCLTLTYNTLTTLSTGVCANTANTLTAIASYQAQIKTLQASNNCAQSDGFALTAGMGVTVAAAGAATAFLAL